MKKINKLLFVLASLMLITFPLGVIVRLSPFENVHIYPQDILVGLTSLIIIVFNLKNIVRYYRKIFYSILAFNLVAIISLLLGSNILDSFEFLVSVSYLVRFDTYVFLLFIGLITFSKHQVRFLKKLFIIVTFIFLVLGFVQYFFYNDLRNLYYLGWDEHLNRLFSTFLDPNFTGIIFALFSIFLFGNYIIDKEIKKGDAFYVFAVLSTVLALILTYSRTALLSIILGMGFLLVSLRKVKILVFSVVILLAGVLLVSDFSEEGANPLRTASIEARLETMNEGFEIFKQNPVIGVGFNAYRYVQIEEGLAREDPKFVSNADSGTDNSLIFVLATTGIVGFTAYLSIWYHIINLTRTLKIKRERVTSYSIIVALFVGAQFVNALFYAPIMMWVFFYLGMFVMRKNNYSSR